MPLATEDYRCLTCGLLRQIQRRGERQRKLGHRKNMLCPRCGKSRRFIKI